MPGPSFRDRKGHAPATKGGLRYPTGGTKSSGKARTTTKPSRAYTPPVQRGSSRGTPLAAVAPKTARRQAAKAQRVQKRQVRRQKQKAQARRKLVKAVKKSGSTGLIKKLDRGFKPGETITPREAAIVTESVGLPGKTYAKGIIPGESGFQPGVRNPDDGTPSLYQITPSVQSAETQRKFDKIASKHKGGYSNPIAAAKQAKYLAQGGDGTSNYVAYDGSPIEHLPGGQKAAKKKLYGKPKPIPKKVVKKAKKYLGPKETKETIKKAKQEAKPEPAKPAKIKSLGKQIQKKFGVTLSEGPGKRSTSPVPSSGHASGSYHYSGAAYDVTGTPEQLAKTYNYLKKNYGSSLEELFYDPMGEHINDGVVQSGGIGGHTDHLHVAESTRAKGGISGRATLSGGGTATSTGGTTASAPATAAARSKMTAAKTKGKRKSKAKAEFERRRRLALELIGEDNPSAVPPKTSYTPSVRTYADTVTKR